MSELPAHSPIGASGMKRWKNCPASVRLSKGIIMPSSTYAEEGTEAHSLAEAILRAKAEGRPMPEVDTDDEEAQKMLDFVMVYVDHMIALQRPNCIQLYEHKFHLKDIHPLLFGTADGVTYYPDKKLLIISDLKYGAGVFVDVVKNEQLLYYALGAVLTLGYPVRKVRIEIIQPRLQHAEAIRPWECDIFDILEFADELKMYAERTEDPNAPMCAGDWCRWCPASAKCPLLKQKAQELAQKVFKPIAKEDDYKDLADTLDWLPILDNWISSVRQFAYDRAMAGGKIARHKLVSKRPRRSWVEEVKAAVAIKKRTGLTEDEIYVTTKSLLSPSQVEKLSLKNTNSRIKKKTELKKVLADLVETKSHGYSLVHESDDRPEFKSVDPKSVFATHRNEVEALT